jgi:hypothetical protein
MTSTYPIGTLGLVAALLAATLYQGNHERNHKLWNIVSTERYILHMQVLLDFGIVYNYMLPVQDMTNENIMVPKHLRSTPVFNVLVVYFRFICSNNPATPAYGVYISQLTGSI